jgi:hypothetical protein
MGRDSRAEPTGVPVVSLRRMVPGEHLFEVCNRAAAAACARGHALDQWSAPPDEDAIARAAVCRRCGRVVYVRAEGGFAGAAGEALTQNCEPEGVGNVEHRRTRFS